MSKKQRPTLYVIEGEDQGKSFPLESAEVFIGRKEGGILLRDSKVSGCHARLRERRGIYSIEDLESTNGTFVDGQRVKSQILHDGAEIQLGFTKLLFRLPREQDESQNEEVSDDGIPAMADIDDLSSIPLAGEASHSQPKAPPPRRRQEPARLAVKVTNGPLSGKELPIGKESFVIGRLNCDLNLPDNDVSRKHALIEYLADGSAVLRDLASTNGTFLNGKKVGNARLSPRDRIQVGRTILLVLAPGRDGK
jgi:ABC transport system ATP-binding/permease protein